MTLPKDKEACAGLDLVPVDGARGTGRIQPTLTVLPRGHFTGVQSGKIYRYTFPALTTKEGLSLLVGVALKRFSDRVGGLPPKLGRLILTAHSGGAAPLMQILRRHDPQEVHVYDGLYQDATPLAEWASRHIKADRLAVQRAAAPTSAMRVFFGPTTRGFSLRLHEALADDLQDAPLSIRDRYRVESSSLGHWQMPRQYGWRILADAATDVPDVVRHGPNRRFVERAEGAAEISFLSDLPFLPESVGATEANDGEAWELDESDIEGEEEFEAFDSEGDSGESPAASGRREADPEDMSEGRTTYDKYGRTDPEFEAFDSEVDSRESPAASGRREADPEDMSEGRTTYDKYGRTDPEIENFQAGVDALFGAFTAGGESAFDGPVGENLLPDGLDLNASVLGWTNLLRLVPASVRQYVENKLLKARGEWLATNQPKRRRFPNEPRTNLDGLSIPQWVNAKAVFGHLTGHYNNQHAALTAADRTKKFSRAPAEILGVNPNNPLTANYFVLHDTGGTQDHTHSSKNGGVHLWIGKVSLARGMDWDRAGDATKLEFGNQTCLIHVELIRATGHSINLAAPNTYRNAGISTARKAGTRYTDQQYDDLANAYIVASIRRGRFLTVTAHKEIDRSAARRGHPNESAHGDPEDMDVERLYRLISRKLVLPADSTFGISQQRINSPNLAGHVNAFIEYARGNAAAANQYAWPIPWQHQNPGLPQGDSTKPPYKSTGLYVMPLLNAANQPILNCGNGKWDQGPP
jgi:hypothetical protein